MKQSTVKILFSSLALIITATLLYFKIPLNSDSLFLESVSRDLFSHGGAWVDWRLSPAPAYFPDMMLYFLTYPLLPNAVWRIFFVSASQVLLLTAAVLWCARKIYPQMSRNVVAILILLIAFINLVAVNSGMWLYFSSTNNHFAALLFPLLSLGLYISFFEQQKKLTAAIVIFLGVSAQLSTAVYLVSFTLPAFIMLSGMFIFSLVTKNKTHRTVLVKMILILIASYVLAQLLDPFITYHHPLSGGRIEFSLERIWTTLHIFKLAIKNAFAIDNLYTATLSYSIIISFIYAICRVLSYIRFKLQMELIHKQFWIHCGISARGDYVDHKITFVALFFIISISINTIGAVLSGGFVDLGGFRYIAFPIALSIIIATISLDRNHPNLKAIGNVFYFVLLASIITLSIHFIQLYKKSAHVIRAADVITCVESVERKGFILHAGIADYWNARGVSYFLPPEIPILATTNDLQPFFWMSTIGPLKRPEHYPEYGKYNFVIVQGISPQFQFTPDELGKILPPPNKVEFCHDAEKTQIWLYENDALDMQMKSVIQGFLKKKKH